MNNKQVLVKYDENVAKNYYLTKKHNIENRDNINFNIADGISFKDDKWDFNHLNTNNRNPGKYRIYFYKVPQKFRYFVKMHILYRILKRKNSVSTCIKITTDLAVFIRALVRSNITEIRLINVNIVKRFIDEYKKEYKRESAYSIVKSISMFIETVEELENIDLSVLKDFLYKSSKELAFFNSLSSKNDYIPDQFLNQLVSLALKDIDNPDLPINCKIFACLLVILAETGMRVEELTMLETGKLDKLEINDMQCNYLHFLTFKINNFQTEYRATYTWMTDKATKAYKKCEELVDQVISGLNEQSKYHLFYYIYSGKLYSRYVKKEQRKTVDGLDKETIHMINRKARKYLWVDTIRGLHKTSTSMFREEIRRFMIRHYMEFDIDRIPIHERKNIKSFNIKSMAVYEKLFSVNERSLLNFEKIKKNNYLYVNPHMFRVTVCTKLFRQGVKLDYIIRHLNHISEDMTNYYNKSYKLINNLEESMRIISEISNEEGLLNVQIVDNESFENYEKDKSINYKIEKINRYLKNNKLNIKNDIKEIIMLMQKTNSPLAENEFGICIRSLAAGICEKKRLFNLHMNDYCAGNQLETYKFLDYNYDRFKQKLEIVRYNERISNQDKRYVVEYEREQKSLRRFVNHTLMTQIELIEIDIDIKGTEKILKDYPRLKNLIEKIDIVKKEILEWM